MLTFKEINNVLRHKVDPETRRSIMAALLLAHRDKLVAAGKWDDMAQLQFDMVLALANKR